MGGKIFESQTKAVTEYDVNEVSKLLRENFSGSGSDFKVIGSWKNRKARGAETSGDLDIVVYNPRMSHYSSILGKISTRAVEVASGVFDNIQEIKDFSPSLVYIRRHNIQIDFHLASSKPLFDWISEATTVPENDVYKPLYRNEILFNLPRYLSGRNIRLNSNNQVLEYTRERFTLWEGLMKSTYSFEGKTGQILKNPFRSDYRLSTSFKDFLTEDCGIHEWTAENPTFLNLMHHLRDKPFYKTLCEDLRKAFVKKNVACPNLISEKS